MRPTLTRSYLPLVRRQIWFLGAIAVVVFVPIVVLVGVLYLRDADLHGRQQENVRTFSAAQDAMLAVDELTATPSAEAGASANNSEWSARERAFQERIANRVGEVLSSGMSSLPEETRPILKRVRTFEAELAAASGPPRSSGRTRALLEALRDSLNQIRLLQEEDFEADNQRFEESTRHILRFAIPVIAALALTGGVLATFLLRAVRRQRMLDEEIRGNLTQSEERYRSLFEGSLDAIFSLGSDGRFVSANPAAERLTGRSFEKLKATHFLELCAPDHRDAAANAFRAAFCRGCLTLDTAMIAASGERRELFISGAPTLLGGEVVGVACIARDVTERRKNEDVQNQERARLRQIIDSQFGFVTVLTLEGAIVEINQAPLTALRLARTDVLGRQFWEVAAMEPAAASQVAEGIRLAAHGGVVREDVATTFPEVGRRDFDMVLSPLRDPAGRIVNVIGFAVDVTERKAAELAQREQDALLRKVSEQVPGVIYQFQLFPDGRSCFPYASEGIRAIYEVTPESVRESAEPVFRVLHPDDFGLVSASIQRSAETMEPWQCEYRVQLPTRGHRWLEGHSVPERLPNGSILWHGYIRDITERKEAEADLQRFAAIVDASGDFIGCATLEGRLQYVNPAGRAMVGLEPSALVGDLHVPDFVPEADHDFLARELMMHLLRDGSWRGEFRLRHFGGQEAIPVDLNSFMIHDAAGKPIAIANISRDIRERLQAARQANRSQRLEAIGTLAGGIAHDLNNALAPVLMATEILKWRYPGEDDLVDTVQRSCERAADMVRQLLTFAKGASGERVLIQPWQLVRELKKFMSGTFPKNIELRSHCASDVGVLLGDPTQLHQVLLNLCVNARDAMPQGGVLTVNVEAETIDATFASATQDATPGRYICLTVEDTGTGIPPDLLDRILEPFFTTKEPDKGTGLGLSTVHGIVKGHRGFMRIDSKLGRGSLFQIYLPVAQDGPDRAELAAQRPAALRGNGETILIVDDEAAILRVARTILERMNFKVITAVNGAEGIICAKENEDTLRVAITDMHMPRMDGLAFAKALRPMCPNVKIVVSSGRLEEGPHAEFQALGVSAVLHKPFTEEKLAEVVRAVLQVSYEL